MKKKFTAIHKVIEIYALVHHANEIPEPYYESILKTWKNMNHQGYTWNQDHAAASLLYAAVTDRIIHISQLTPKGYKAIKWAESFMHSIESKAA